MSVAGVTGKRVLAIYGHPDDEGQATGTLAAFVAAESDGRLDRFHDWTEWSAPTCTVE